MKQKVAIILINFNGLKDTLECLDSLAGLKTKHSVSIYIVNYDQTQAQAKLSSHQTKPIIIPSTKNLGFAGHNNLGIKQAAQDGHEYFVLLNNDTTVDPGFLEPLLQTLQDQSVGLVCPKIYFSPGKEFHHGSYTDQERGRVLWYAGGCIDWRNMILFHRGVDEVDRGQFDDEQETDFVTGCCIAFSKKTLKAVGYMPEDYFMYLEDADWSMQAKKAGLKTVYQPKAVIWHKNGGSTGGSGSSFQQKYLRRNLLRFGLKYAPIKTKLLLLASSLGLK